jgi:hypothetical protein
VRKLDLNMLDAIIGGVLALLAGVVFGFVLDTDPAPLPAQNVNITVQPGQPTQPVQSASEPANVELDTPFYAPEATPEETLLQAIALMKPGGSFNGEATPAARQLAIQLVSNGYYYWTTYPNGTERINHEAGDTSTVHDDVEFAISNKGAVLLADRFGFRTTRWGVECLASPSVSSTVDDLNFLLTKTRNAAKKWNADQSCVYTQFDK